MKYSKEQIKKDRKIYLQEMIKNANDLISVTQGTEICWEVSCNYEKFDKNIIEVLKNKEECKEMLKDWKNDEETKGAELFYRPIVIDSDSGETVSFQNLHYYKKDSHFVKELNKYLHA